MFIVTALPVFIVKKEKGLRRAFYARYDFSQFARVFRGALGVPLRDAVAGKAALHLYPLDVPMRGGFTVASKVTNS